jgi:hypothetical protein
VVPNLGGISSTNINTFVGLITDEEVAIPSEVTIPFITGTDNATDIPVDLEVFAENITFGIWDLKTEIEGKYYHESYSGPSYFDRLENNPIVSNHYQVQTPYNIGLVSFIDFDELSSHGLPVNRTLSRADYKYFSGEDENYG